jgi:peptidoglycan-associated lipoprotein
MPTMTRVTFALGSLALAVLPWGCATHTGSMQTAAVVAPPPPAPVVPDAAPVSAAPSPDQAAVAPAPEPVKEFAARDELKDVHFASGEIQVRPSDRKALDAAAAWLKANRSQLVILEGHTDVAGRRAVNLGLAQARAKWVMDYLVAKGVPASRITVVSRGEDGTLCADKSTACQNRNRRVHFLVRESGPLQVSASPSR